MQTRIIQTRFYKDNDVRKLSLYGQHLFLYLLTSEHINISGIFELPDDYISLESKLTPEQLQQAKIELSNLNKVLFSDGWVKVVNAEKNNKYRNSPSNETAYQREIERVPKHILDLFLDTSVNSTPTLLPTVVINNKQEIINNKQEIEKEKISKIEEKFNEFWNLYPEKKSKKKAFEKYKQVYDKHDEIMKGLNAYINHTQYLEKKKKDNPLERIFIPAYKHPTTWLNGACWEDEYTGEFKKVQIRTEEKLKEKEIEKKADDRKKLENIFNITRNAWLDKNVPGWNFMKDYIGNPENQKKVAEYFKKLYPKEYNLLQLNNE